MRRPLSYVQPETKFDAQQLAKRLRTSEATAVTLAIHYFSAITSQSHDKSITDLARMREAEAKVEWLKDQATAGR
jgi:hypothetical protein